MPTVRELAHRGLLQLLGPLGQPDISCRDLGALPKVVNHLSNSGGLELEAVHIY